MVNLIKGYRCAIGYSQEKMAKHLNISTNSYADKENFKRPFTSKEIEKYKDTLQAENVEININDIFFNH